MSHVNNYKNVKKELSRTALLDGMKKDMLEELNAVGWNNNWERHFEKYKPSNGEMTFREILDSLGTTGESTSADMKWEEIARTVLEKNGIPPDVKEKIFKKWGRRLRNLKS